MNLLSVGTVSSFQLSKRQVRTSAGIPYFYSSILGGFSILKGDGVTPTSFTAVGSYTAGVEVGGMGCAIDSDNIIHFSWVDDQGKNSPLMYITFNCNTDTLGTPVVVLANTGGVDPSRLYLWTAIAVDSNKVPHIFYTGLIKVGGANHYSANYINRVGGAWNQRVVVEGNDSCHRLDIIIDQDNIPVVANRRGSTVDILARGNANNTTVFTVTTASSYHTRLAQMDDKTWVYAGGAGTTLRLWMLPFASGWGGTPVTIDWVNTAHAVWRTPAVWTMGRKIWIYFHEITTNYPKCRIYDVDTQVIEDVVLLNQSLGDTSHMFCKSSTHFDYDKNGSLVNPAETDFFIHNGTSGQPGYWGTLPLSTNQNIVLAAAQGVFALTGQAADLTRTQGVQHYTIGADQGSFVVTGQATTLSIQYIISLNFSQFVVAGQDANFALHTNFIADKGDFTLTGQSVDFVRAHTLHTQHGSFAVTGQDAVLTTVRNYVLPTISGSFLIAGQATSFALHRMMLADQGSLLLTGSAISFDLRRNYTVMAQYATFAVTGQESAFSVSRNPVLQAEVGSIAVTGNNIEVVITGNQTIDAGTGNIAITGNVTDLSVGHTLHADSSQFVVTGGEIAIEVYREYILEAASGYFTLTGVAASFDDTKSYTLLSDLGTFVIVSQDVIFVRQLVISVEHGGYSCIGFAVLPIVARVSPVQHTSIVVTGYPVAINKQISIIAEPAAFQLTGMVASFDETSTYTLVTETGHIDVTGRAAQLQVVRDYKMDAGTGLYTVSGVETLFNKQWLFSTDHGTIAVTAHEVHGNRGYTIQTDQGTINLSTFVTNFQKALRITVDKIDYVVFGNTVDLQYLTTRVLTEVLNGRSELTAVMIGMTQLTSTSEGKSELSTLVDGLSEMTPKVDGGSEMTPILNAKSEFI